MIPLRSDTERLRAPGVAAAGRVRGVIFCVRGNADRSADVAFGVGDYFGACRIDFSGEVFGVVWRSEAIPVSDGDGGASGDRFDANWGVSFILAQVSLRAGLITSAIYNATLVASLVTILANATLFKIFVKKAPVAARAVP